MYVQECARILFISEDVLQREVGKYFNEYALKSREERERGGTYTDERKPAEAPDATAEAPRQPSAPAAAQHTDAERELMADLRRHELGVARLVARYGNYAFAEVLDEDGNTSPITVLEYIISDLEADGIRMVNPDVALLMDAAVRLSREAWDEDLARESARLQEIRARAFAAGVEEIRQKATDMGSITAMERSLNDRIDAEYQAGLADFSAGYLARLMCSSADDTVRALATDLVVETHILSKMHTKYAHVPTERDLLPELVDRALFELKDAIIWTRIKDARRRLAGCGEDFERMMQVMAELKQLEEQRKTVSKLIGDRVIAPRK